LDCISINILPFIFCAGFTQTLALGVRRYLVFEMNVIWVWVLSYKEVWEKFLQCFF